MGEFPASLLGLCESYGSHKETSPTHCLYLDLDKDLGSPISGSSGFPQSTCTCVLEQFVNGYLAKQNIFTRASEGKLKSKSASRSFISFLVAKSAS